MKSQQGDERAKLASTIFAAPGGKLLIEASPLGVVSLKAAPPGAMACGENPATAKAVDWLESYFAGKPGVAPPLDLAGTHFQKAIWNILLEIPYGACSSYGEICKIYEQRFNRRSSPRAVGGAIAANPVWIVIPCHRIIHSDGKLGGYAGGVEMKKALLDLEKDNS